METTTDIDKLARGVQFAWGEIKRIEEIGPYTIAKYEDFRGKILYHYWVDKKDSCHSAHSLDAALAGAMSYRSEGPNGCSGSYFITILESINPLPRPESRE